MPTGGGGGGSYTNVIPGTVSDTIASINSSCTGGKTYVASVALSVATGGTINSGCTVVFPTGGLWTIASGQTVTFINQISGGLSQHFAGSGTVAFSGNQQEADIEWWGAVPDWNGTTGTDNTTAINACFSAKPVQCVGQVGSYAHGATLNVANSGVGFKGATQGFTGTPPATALVNTSTTATNLKLQCSGTCVSNRFENFSLQQSAPSGTSIRGFDIENTGGVIVRNVHSDDTAYPFYLSGMAFYGVGGIFDSEADCGYVTGASFTHTMNAFYIDGSVPALSTRLIRPTVGKNSGCTATIYGFNNTGVNTSDILIEHPVTASVDFPIYVNGGSTTSGDFQVINPVLDQSTGPAITVLNNPQGIRVSGGFITEQSSSAHAIDIENSSQVSIVGTQIIRPGSTDAIYISGGDHNLVSGVTCVTQVTGSGPCLSANVTSNNTFTGNDFQSVNTAASIIKGIGLRNSTISGNTLSGSATDGISLDANSVGNSGVNQNTISTRNITTPVSDLGSANNGTVAQAVWQGAWSATQSYVVGQQVSYSGGVYVNIGNTYAPGTYVDSTCGIHLSTLTYTVKNAGDVLVLASGSTTPTPTDTQGNTWTLVASNTPNLATSMWSTTAASSGSVTITPTGTIFNIQACVIEFRGLTGAVNATATANGTGTSYAPSITPTASSVIVGEFNHGANATVFTSATLQVPSQANGGASIAIGYIQQPAGTYTVGIDASLTGSGAYVSGAFTLGSGNSNPSVDTTHWLAIGGSGSSVTWPSSGSLVVSNSTNSPAGIAPVNGDCVVGSGGSWIAGSCSGAASNPSITIANAGTTGTTLSTLAKLTGAPSTAVITATTDSSGAVGIVTSGAGTTGSATITTAGQVSCVFSNATTAGDYVQISGTTAGNCVDAGATYPTSGQVIGRVLSTNGASGTYQINLFPSEIKASSGGGIAPVTVSVSGLSEVDFTASSNTCLSSSYGNYEIRLEGVTVSVTKGTMSVQMQTASGFDTANNYYANGINWGGSVTLNPNPNTAINGMYMYYNPDNSIAASSTDGRLTLSIASGKYPHLYGMRMSSYDGASNYWGEGTLVTGTYKQTTAITGFRILPDISGGTFTGGKIVCQPLSE